MTHVALPEIILKPRRSQPFFMGHPWVFAGAIAKISDGLADGDEVLLVSHEGTPIARGLFNSASQIQVRLYSWNLDLPLDEQFWRERLQAAIALRSRIFGDEAHRQACRLVFSEADGLSGLTVDRFGDWLSLQLTSQALATRCEMLCDLLEEIVHPAGIWLRTEKGMTAAEGLTLQDGLLRGEPPAGPLTIREHGIEYLADLQEGQKTGFYFDQRDNRKAAARYLTGDVLDICCYSGGFALNAAQQERVTRVTGVDSSANAIELANQNADRNGLTDKCEFVTRDSLKYLNEETSQYDGIILDPPKFARSRGGIKRALKAYFKWNVAALNRLKSPGVLVTCSCSGLVTKEQFHDVLRDAASETGRFVRILEERGQAADHPVSLFCPENDYLKCLICAVE